MSATTPKTDTIPCELIIQPRWIVPIEPAGILSEHAIAIDAGKIVALGPATEILARYQPHEHRVLPEHLLMPGLINAHCHSAMTLMRGLADDLPLMRWLSEHIWPTEGKHISREFVQDGTRLAIAEQIQNGVTTVQDMYFFSEAVAEQAAEMGMRAVVGAIVIEFPSAYASGPEQYFAKARELIQHYRTHPLIAVSLAPHAPYTVSDDSFGQIRELAERENLQVHCHVHETAGEVSDSLAQHGLRPLARLQKLGLVNQRLNAVHMTQLEPEEIAILAQSGVSVLHCPESNLKLASGFCPVQALQLAGVNVALGTDGCASNNDLDLLGELKTAALLAKGVAGDATALGAQRALEMATLAGARALGLEQMTGSLKVGKAADCIALRFDELDLLPVYNPISHVVYANHRRQVTDVWIAGVSKMRAGLLCDIDLPSLCANARAWGERIQRSAL